jgi:hypothetical protein
MRCTTDKPTRPGANYPQSQLHPQISRRRRGTFKIRWELAEQGLSLAKISLPVCIQRARLSATTAFAQVTGIARAS